jgi:hypothetical protein
MDDDAAPIEEPDFDWEAMLPTRSNPVTEEE